MKTSQILNILMAAALVVLSVKLVTDSKEKSADSQSQDGTLETIMTRTSVRDYQDKPKRVAYWEIFCNFVFEQD